MTREDLSLVKYLGDGSGNCAHSSLLALANHGLHGSLVESDATKGDEKEQNREREDDNEKELEC